MEPFPNPFDPKTGLGCPLGVVEESALGVDEKGLAVEEVAATGLVASFDVNEKAEFVFVTPNAGGIVVVLAAPKTLIPELPKGDAFTSGLSDGLLLSVD